MRILCFSKNDVFFTIYIRCCDIFFLELRNAFDFDNLDNEPIFLLYVI